MVIGNGVHSLVRSDLAPDVFHLLTSDFATDADVKQSVTSWLHILDTDFYATIQALVPR
jgi:hypothetical protein